VRAVAIAFYRDEDAHILVAIIGRQAGLDARLTQEYGRNRTTYAVQLAFAAQEWRVLVTVNCSDVEPITARFSKRNRRTPACSVSRALCPDAIHAKR